MVLIAVAVTDLPTYILLMTWHSEIHVVGVCTRAWLKRLAGRSHVRLGSKLDQALLRDIIHGVHLASLGRVHLKYLIVDRITPVFCQGLHDFWSVPLITHSL